MRDPDQLVLLLDLSTENPISPDEVLALVPDKRDRRVLLRLTDFGATPTPRGVPADWATTADAVTRMLARARAELPAGGPPVHVYVAGRAALPIFAHLGMELSKWARVTLFNQRPDGAWDSLPIQGVTPPGERFFKVIHGLSADTPSESTGRVAVFISTSYGAPRDELRAFVTAQGEALAGIVEVLPGGEGTTWLAEANAPVAAQELVELFVRVSQAYPHCKGVALFIAGAAPLAFLAGRAINPNIVRDVWVPNHLKPSYYVALTLPWKGRARPAPSLAPEAELARERALRAMLDQVERLRKTLAPEHLPPFLTEAERTGLLDRLARLEIDRRCQGDAFALSVTERKMAFGRGLVDALLGVPDEATRARIAQSIVLHELFHVDQEVLSTTYLGVGRAGFALEEVDYRADTVALGTLATWEIARRGPEGREQARSILLSHLDAALAGIEAFDRSEQGALLDRLYERRLRRYLIWHLQRARAATIEAPEDVWALCGERLLVELAPLDGTLDERFDKLVKGPLQATELFVVLDGRLCRTPKQGWFDPGTLVEAVRRFDREALRAAMERVRDHHRRVLLPWVK